MRIAYILFGFILFFSCSGPEEGIYPTKTKVTESVYASATVQPDSLYKVYASVGGILDKNLVEEGDTVTRGAPLIQIINSRPKLEAENARLALQLAQENYNGSAAVLSSLEDEIHTAALSFTDDSLNFFRQKRLWEQNIGSKTQYEKQKLAFELSRNQLRLLKSKYERTENELTTQLEQARNNYRTSLIASQDFTVSSKINGRVYAIYKNPGENVNSMEALALVGSADAFVVNLLVDEVDIVRLQVGQTTLITLDAYGDSVFKARVSKIYPQKDERSQTFTVEALFDNPPETLYPGLAGEANIIIGGKEDALSIPKAYLIDGNKVRTEEGVVELTLGLQDLERVEVLAGINMETKILKPAQ